MDHDACVFIAGTVFGIIMMAVSQIIWIVTDRRRKRWFDRRRKDQP